MDHHRSHLHLLTVNKQVITLEHMKGIGVHKVRGDMAIKGVVVKGVAFVVLSERLEAVKHVVIMGMVICGIL